MTSGIGRIALVVALGMPALLPLSPAAAAQDPPCGRNLPMACLVVRTVPRLSRVSFLLDGRRFVTDRRGVARIDATRSERPLLSLVERRVERGGLRAVFSRWGDDAFTLNRTVVIPSQGNKVLEVGFDVENLVSLAYRDQDGARVQGSRIVSVELGNSVGGRLTVDPPRAPLWVPAGRIVRRLEGLRLNPIPYSVKSVVVDGSNVVNEGQQVFDPAPHASWVVELLFYDATFSVQDRFFGFPTGSSIDLVYPDGHSVQHPLVDGEVRVNGLPRGNYDVIVHGPGLRLRAPVAVSRDTDAKLVLLSYLDIGVAIVLGLALAVGLVRIGRRRLARESGGAPATETAIPEGAEPVEVGGEMT
jgi:hypothetical protein